MSAGRICVSNSMASACGDSTSERPGTVEIVRDSSRNRFRTKDGVAYLEYRLVHGKGSQKNGFIDLMHTYVPASKRGMGVAAELCKAAFLHAKDNNLRVIPTCSYVSDTFLLRNPEWKTFVSCDIKPAL